MPGTRWFSAAAGVVAAGIAAAAGELAAAALSPALSPVTAVGSVVVDAVPAPVKDWAIAVFGTSDKLALLAGMLLLILAVGAVCGLLEAKRPPWGSAILAGFGVLGAAAVLTRAQFSPRSTSTQAWPACWCFADWLPGFGGTGSHPKPEPKPEPAGGMSCGQSAGELRWQRLGAGWLSPPGVPRLRWMTCVPTCSFPPRFSRQLPSRPGQSLVSPGQNP